MGPDWVPLTVSDFPSQYDPHLRDMISAAGGQLEETALPSEKKHRVSTTSRVV